jgi:phosphoribosylanthranilate isomerase
MDMLYKVCGLKYPGNISDVLNLNPDFVGFNFYPKSPRYIKSEELVIAQSYNYGKTKKVGVFVNESYDRIIDDVHHYGLDYVQLHGNESPEEAMKVNEKVPVIKAIGIETKEDMESIADYKGCCDYILLDKKSASFGGTGVPFDWDLLQYYPLQMPFFLAGGISSQNITRALALKHPQLAGLDLNSGFEDAPGLKDVGKLKKIIDNG